MNKIVLSFMRSSILARSTALRFLRARLDHYLILFGRMRLCFYETTASLVTSVSVIVSNEKMCKVGKQTNY